MQVLTTLMEPFASACIEPLCVNTGCDRFLIIAKKAESHAVIFPDLCTTRALGLH
jgi:hypothetical protein